MTRLETKVKAAIKEACGAMGATVAQSLGVVVILPQGEVGEAQAQAIGEVLRAEGLNAEPLQTAAVEDPRPTLLVTE